ncbi:cytochrome c oxidase subunit II [Methylobacterium brachiatum]|jgi:cytochrome c oxidase subunit 2|uniref:cytochrome c oxidase subunit II n=1 Tax=Methylobacterium brachiatum TaxID=269660 RepID=UPI0008ED7F29|nr:cytochrome c oxidase subunit II [Methylobacterium brachiatum]SFI99870.1 cytochrome c oxidase subunit 2 [Methylobacterium brachiatum]
MTPNHAALELWPPAISATASETDLLILAFTVLTLLLTVPVFVAITYFALRYREGSEADRHPSGIRSNLIEISWMLIPFLLTLIFFVWGARLFIASKNAPPDAMVIEAIGRQWMWKFQHPTGQAEINDLHLPIGQPIRLRIISQDVIHALYLPALRLQVAALPDRYTDLWFKADKIGTYHLHCSEYCGTDHSVMGGQVTFMNPGDYQEWLTHAGAQQSKVAAGRTLYEAYGCAGCHDPGSTVKAPSLVGLYGSPVKLADGRTVTADETWLREKILNPNGDRLAEGYKQVMPSFAGRIPEDELGRLIDFLKSYTAPASGKAAQANP